ncbi:MAG TPA: hypothetical protein VNB22_08445 [Pyrinomonadaceae bacterium]|jgi:hypothetical protein|nr:hypothetical protein [Pyrinomonadaceae bacterium]
MLKDLIKIVIISGLIFSFSCNSANTQTKEPSREAESESNSQNKQEVVFTEPIKFTGIKSNDKIDENIKTVWKNFVADGKYRLAQPFDMKFSEAAKSQLPGQGKSPIVPYEYIWGDLNFGKRIEDDHLAAIVVDTTKDGNDRFGLVIFSPVKNTKNKYDVNWLYHNADLSKTTVNRASGYFYVSTFSDDGSRKACSVKWDKKLNKFECK